MVWRIHFTPDDLERIQVGPTLGPLAETVMAVALLGCPQQPRALLGEWRGQVQGRITPRMRPLTALIPPGCKGVDLCTLTGEAPTIEQGVQALLDIPREHLLVEMEYTDRHSRLPAAAWALAEAGRRPELADATLAAYQELVRPYWSRIRACLHAEQAARSRTLAREGAGRAARLAAGPADPLAAAGPGDRDADRRRHGATRPGHGVVPSLFVGKDPQPAREPERRGRGSRG